MSYTYTQYVANLQNLLAVTLPDDSFTNILPMCIDYAEQRCYRDLNLLNNVVRDYSTTLTASQRNATVNAAFYVINQINILSPAGATQTNGSRIPLTPATPEMVDMLWPGNGTVGTPEMFGMIDQFDLVLGPSPDAAYLLEVIGTQRPTPLSASNTTTFLTQYLPDLFFAASMVFMSGWMRNYGSQSSDPQMSSSWEDQYTKLLASAETEELTKLFNGASWTSQRPSPIAQPQRG